MGEYKANSERMLLKILSFEVGGFDKDENTSSVICSGLAKDANVRSPALAENPFSLHCSFQAPIATLEKRPPEVIAIGTENRPPFLPPMSNQLAVAAVELV
ncbi:hypothetical protein PanWU01x14_159320 [Parasponia andersonii]|uniref:Uncharacterized protein n=1 Tax=Parasponia andersonii TaxID=3476 RepID=A0A2P5CED5_PARAD|nr:hypothetical protein PanWU01x14_159320 [Parasponia andersonii]